jgi:hypothetical protein
MVVNLSQVVKPGNLMEKRINAHQMPFRVKRDGVRNEGLQQTWEVFILGLDKPSCQGWIQCDRD